MLTGVLSHSIADMLFDAPAESDTLSSFAVAVMTGSTPAVTRVTVLLTVSTDGTVINATGPFVVSVLPVNVTE